jgi:hypothetical protein
MTLLNIGCGDYHNVWPANRHRVYPGLSCQDALGDNRPVSDKAKDRQPLIQATNRAGSVERGAWSKNELQASHSLLPAPSSLLLNSLQPFYVPRVWLPDLVVKS